MLQEQETERKDCFAYPKEGNTEGYCLNKLYCKNEKCNFYQSKEEISISQLESAVRMYNP